MFNKPDVFQVVFAHIFAQSTPGLSTVGTFVDRYTGYIILGCQAIGNVCNQHQFCFAGGNFLKGRRGFYIVGWNGDQNVRLQRQQTVELF